MPFLFLFYFFYFLFFLSRVLPSLGIGWIMVLQ
jgi:hypothetical protein